MDLDCNYVIGLGFFDGVHLGHGAILNNVKSMAEKMGAKSAVITFDDHPLSYVNGESVKLLTSPEDRCKLMRELYGIDEIIVLRFNRSLMTMNWNEFLDILISDYHAVGLVFGYDYSCGYKGEGTAVKIQKKCDELGICCIIVPPFFKNGIRVSSSVLREVIADGNMEYAHDLYGHPHIFSSVVRSGKKLGRKLNAPTVNMLFPSNILIPRFGVYAVKVLLPDGSTYKGVANIGTRPSIDDGNQITAETFILDYSGSLYGEKLTLMFYKYIRPERQFDSLESLKKQIAADCDTVRDYFKENIE